MLVYSRKQMANVCLEISCLAWSNFVDAAGDVNTLGYHLIWQSVQEILEISSNLKGRSEDCHHQSRYIDP